MNLNNNIEEELKGLNSSLPSGKTETFSVPEGYFDNLATSILLKIKDDNPREELGILSPLLASISKEMPYSVPENYFDTNIEVLPYILNDRESSVLSFTEKVGPYEVPVGYFENFAKNIQDKIEKPTTTAKVVPMFSRKWIRMAAAAVVIGIISLTGYNYFKNDNLEIENPVVAVDTTQKTETINSTNHTASLKQELKTMSTQELNTFIEKVDVTPTKATVTKTATKKEVRELIKDVSDKELDSFLEQVSYTDDELFIID